MGNEGKAMNRALAERCQAIRALLERAETDEIVTRYKVGALVAKVRDEKGTYGERAVEQVAASLHRDAATLYRAASVADVWTWRELRGLTRRRNREGNLLTWSHWVELARVPRAWEKWMDQALEGAWSVRVLAGELDAAIVLEKERRRPEAVVEDTTEVALAETLRSVRRFGTEVAGALEAVLDRIERDLPGERAEKVPELLARALDLIEDAHAKTGVLAARVRRLTPASPPAGPRRSPREERA